MLGVSQRPSSRLLRRFISSHYFHIATRSKTMRCKLMNIAAFLAMSLFMASCFAVDSFAPVAAQPAAQTAASAAYPLPENGTPAQYMTFIEKLLQVKPPQNQSHEEAVAHFTALHKAEIAAADKIIESPAATPDQIQRAVAVKIRSLEILIKAGSKKAKIVLYSMPSQLEKVGQPKIADDIVMGLINMTIKDAKKTKNYSEIEKIIEQTTQTIQKTPAENKEKLQRLYLVKLIYIKALGRLKGIDNSAEFNAVVEEVKKAGLTEMVEDIYMGRITEALSLSIAKKDPKMFDKIALTVDNTIKNYGANVNVKIVAIAFQTAHTEENFDQAAAVARYEKYIALFEKYQDPEIQRIVKNMRGSVNRLTIKGKAMPLKGKTIDGKDFNMADLKDKKVVVYFWSPSVRPSLEELNYLRRAYLSYQAKGLELVCIGLDIERARFAEFVAKYRFPWINIWEYDAYIGGVYVCDYYGIVSLPYVSFIGVGGYVYSSSYLYTSMEATFTAEFGELTVSETEVTDIEFNDFEDISEAEAIGELDEADEIDDVDDIDDNTDANDIDDLNDADNDLDADDIDDVDDNADVEDIDDADNTDVNDVNDIDDVDENADVDNINDADDNDANDAADDANDAADDADDTADDTADDADDTADDNTADDTADDADDTADDADDTADDSADDDTTDDTADDTADDDTADDTDDTADDDTADDGGDDYDDGGDDGGDFGGDDGGDFGGDDGGDE